MKHLKGHGVAIAIALFLAVMPFFWLKANELELGGDSSRLYLYDPAAYLRSTALYSVEVEGLGKVRPDQNLLPYLLFLSLIDSFFESSYILTSLVYSISLVGAFLSVYFIVIEIVTTAEKVVFSRIIKISAIIAGLFYVFSPSVGKPMQTALIIHNQVFLNPLIFLLLLRFLKTHKDMILWILLLLTIIFAPNFSLKAPTAPFSFYPIAILFLCIYVRLCLKHPLPWRKLSCGIILFFGLHAFHIVPVAYYTFDPGSNYNLRAFDVKTNLEQGIGYFNAILPYGMVTKSFFYSYLEHWPSLIAPLTILLGFLFSSIRRRVFLLISLFFFVTVFLESANITNVGIEIYRRLFYIPGFSMFRNFSGQWQWVQAFFYSLFFGYALSIVLMRSRKIVSLGIAICIAGLIVLNCWQFISGGILRQPHRATNNVSTVIEIDRYFEQLLSFINSLPYDGKFFDFPFTEFGYQVLPGLNRGAYIGPSPISYLTGRRNFSGHAILEPFSEKFLELINRQDYKSIKRLFGLLNVKYIMYISDPRAYKEFFPEVPYTLLLKVLPDFKSLSDFVNRIVGDKVFQKGTYHIYETDRDYFLPHFYVPKYMKLYESGSSTPNDTGELIREYVDFFINESYEDPRVVFLDQSYCTGLTLKCSRDSLAKFDSVPLIQYQRINPTKYRVVISDVMKPFFIVFSDQYHKDWNAYVTVKHTEKLPVISNFFDGAIQELSHKNIFLDYKTFDTLFMKKIPDRQHISVNGYANAWYITPSDFGNKESYEIIIELSQQRLFYISLSVSLISFIIFVGYGLRSSRA